MNRFRKIALIALLLVLGMTMVYAEGTETTESIPREAPAQTVIVEEAKAFQISSYSAAVSVTPAFNVAGFGISAKGFNMSFGLSFEMAVHEKISVGAKLSYNILFGYIQSNVFGKYDVIRLGNGDLYALLALGADYTLKANRFSFVAEAGAGYEYDITQNISAFAEISTQFSMIRHFDINGNIGARYTF